MKKGTGTYNVIAIGAGTAGLVTTSAIAGLGGRAALIEKNKMGGDCLNFGCVPSKGLISSARVVQTIRKAENWGLESQEPQFEFSRVFESMRARRAIIEPLDSQERFEGLGVDVFRGDAKFISPHEVEVNGQVLRGKNLVIASGSRAGIPPIPGLNEIPYYTNETIFDELNEKPESMIIIGGGPIGCELGQAMNRLGVKVYLMDLAPQILIREDPEVSAYAREYLEAEGVNIYTGIKTKKFSHINGKIHLEYEGTPNSQGDGVNATLEVDVVLVSAGRIPNIESLNLEAAGVEFDKRGVKVNQYMQNNQSHIWAAGDIAGSYQFTHVADFQARTVVRNILMPFSLFYSKMDYSVIPWSTYISPEVARVGLNETEAKQQGIDYDLFTLEMKDVDRAILDNADHGFIKILTEKGKDRIIGVTIVADHGGDLLHEFVLAIKYEIGLGKIASTIHAYPTFAELARKLGDQYNRSRLTPRAKSIFTWLFQRQIK